MLLKRTITNYFFKEIESLDSISNYAYDEFPNAIPKYAIIKRLNTEYYFKVEFSNNNYVEFVPGINTLKSNYAYGSDDYLTASFDSWIMELIKELEEDNLWEQQKKRPKVLMQGIIFDSPERQFTQEEKAAMLQEVNKLQKLLIQKAESPASTAKIEKQITEIKEALNTKTNFEWFNFLADKGFDLGLLVAYEHRHEIMHAIKGIFDFYNAILHQLVA